MDRMTQKYRHYGAILGMSKGDANVLVLCGIGSLDPVFNADGQIGVHVPGYRIDRFVPGEPPRLFLVGGIEIVRDDEKGDAIASIRTINIDGLFDEENE